MNHWNSIGLFLKIYVGIRMTIIAAVTPESWWTLLVGSVGAVLIAWFTWDVVAYIKRNGGESR